MREYLGAGVKHPAEITSQGRAALVAEIELVKQAIRRVLGTPVGSEFLNRSKGSFLELLIFEPNDQILYSLLEYFIGDAIDKWVPNAQYQDTTFEAPTESPGLVKCLIKFRVRGSATEQALVYPFYRQENTL